LAAVRFGADAVGFVFFGGSPRAVKPADAAMISGQLPTSTLKVGVFVDEEPERLRTIASMARLDVVQLHGNERPEYCAALKDFRVWKAVRIGGDINPESLAAYDVEAFLLDTASGDA
jgi:phosphoribosylanthranilate isomerase